MGDAITIGSTQAGRALRLDVPRLIDTRMLVQANSGGGKSRLLRRILEEAHAKVQSVVLDPEGEFSTLRERYDFLLVGRGGEVPAEPRAAALLARRLLELRVSAVVDLYELKLAGRREFVRLFLEALLALPKELYRPLLVAIDEAHLYAPERSHGEAESTDAVISLLSQGRKRGLCGVLLTQRLSKLHKDAAAECNNVAIGRTWLDVDQKRAADVLGLGTAAERQGLRDLEAGEFLAFGPAFDAPGVTRFRGGDVRTTHPKAGERHRLEAPAPSAAIKAAIAELKDLPQQAAEELRTLQAAQARVRELERELRATKAARPAPPGPAQVRRVEVPVLKEAHVRRLEVVARRLEAALRIHNERVEGAHTSLAEGLGLFGRTVATLTAAAAAVSPKAPIPAPQTPAVSRRAPIVSRAGAIVSPKPSGQAGDEKALTGPEQRILDALAWLEAVGQREAKQAAAAFLAGYTVGGGAYNNPRGALRKRGLIEYRGDRLALTDAGRQFARAPAEALTAAELQARVLEQLPGPEGRLLRALLDVYPQGLTNEDLAARAGYSPNGGAFANPRGRLRSLGLIDYREGLVVALPVLFLEE